MRGCWRSASIGRSAQPLATNRASRARSSAGADLEATSSHGPSEPDPAEHSAAAQVGHRAVLHGVGGVAAKTAQPLQHVAQLPRHCGAGQRLGHVRVRVAQRLGEVHEREAGRLHLGPQLAEGAEQLCVQQVEQRRLRPQLGGEAQEAAQRRRRAQRLGRGAVRQQLQVRAERQSHRQRGGRQREGRVRKLGRRQHLGAPPSLDKEEELPEPERAAAAEVARGVLALEAERHPARRDGPELATKPLPLPDRAEEPLVPRRLVLLRRVVPQLAEQALVARLALVVCRPGHARRRLL
mmetsp:Transcript_44400/g.136757  ORF Transcript_44400/g.136757 Transcript_44400/m.136757 type:complete len:295 (-) Transcript_44400:272-1156(-)